MFRKDSPPGTSSVWIYQSLCKSKFQRCFLLQQLLKEAYTEAGSRIVPAQHVNPCFQKQKKASAIALLAVRKPIYFIT